MKTSLALFWATLTLLILMTGLGSANAVQLPAELRDHGAIILLIDPQDGAILDTNTSAAAFYGYPVSVLRTMHIQDINMFDAEEVAEEMRRARSEQRNYFLFPHRLADGVVRTVEVYSSPYRMPDGRSLLLSIIHDATDKAIVEPENLAYRTRLESLVAQRSKEAMAAHFRTTMVTVVALLLLLGLLFWLYRKHRNMKQYRLQYELEQQRNQAQQELRASEELLATAARMARFGGWRVDLAEQKVVWSEGVAMIHDREPGYSPDVSEGISYYAPEWREHITRIFRECANSGVSYDQEMEIITAKGRRVWVRTTGDAVRDEQGEITQVHGAFQDVTVRKQAELALGHTLQELAHLVAAIPSLLISLDRKQNVVRWNQKAEELFGLHSKVVLGRSLRDCPVPWEWEMVSQALEECERTGSPIRVDDVPFTQRGGEPGFLGISVSMIPHDDDDHRGFLLLGRDITRTRLLENQLLQAQKMESLGHLAAGIAHEINTPIQFVGSNLSFLRDSCENIKQMLQHYSNFLEAGRNLAELAVPVETVERYKADIDLDFLLREIGASLEEVQVGVDRVAGIVRSMRMLSHPGKQGKAAVDLNGILESVVILSRNEWKRHVAIETNFQQDLPMVVCMAAEISQAVLNLLVNAVQAVAEQVESGRIAQGRIGIASRQDGDWVEIRIEDNGGGIAPEHQPRIFDPFFTTKDVGKGTGQGLAIAHAVIVGKHGGAITFTSDPGIGTVFIVRLPVFDADQAGKVEP